MGNIPLVTIDEDFFEHLLEMGYDTKMDTVEFIEEWYYWSKENCI